MLSKDLIKKVRQIQIKTSHQVTESMAGEYKSAFKGRGMEFEDVRLYMPGDDIRSIDWNVTARTGEPYVKRFVEERELTVMLMVDASSSGAFGSISRSKQEVAAELAALLAYTAIRSNDRIGLIIFTDKIELFIPPKKGRSHVLRVIREILYFNKPERGTTDITNALGFLNKVCSKRSVVFLISDFLCDNYDNAMLLTTKRHDLIPVTITDPREVKLPNIGLINLTDAETGENILVDTSSSEVRREFERLAKLNLDGNTKKFRQMNADSIGIMTDKPYVDELVKYFKKREKAAL